jgi:threonine/homoserine/homoserine lactone efflux protein
MDLVLLARSIVLGFTVAAAVGPIALLTIRRTLAHGRAYGLASGLGVALADATYAAIAAFGLTAVTSVLVGGRVVLGLAGGAVLVWLGIRTIASRPRLAAADDERPGLAGALASIYGLTLTNPLTIVSFVGLFAALGLATRGYVDAATMTFGVFAGSGLWWVLLVGVVAWFRARVTLRALTWVNRISGSALLGFGLLAIAAAVASR